ncbi:MAG: hypothetical protein VXW26_17380, partial [SAR324 cluster bacterium]|nr:hypothetical protein [SAR324 cluster bacterium]
GTLQHCKRKDEAAWIQQPIATPTSSQIHQKSITTPGQIHPKSIKKQPKSIQNRSKIKLRAIFASKNCLPSILGPSRTVSGAVLARLGRQVEPSWLPKLSQKPENIDAKIHQKIDAFQDRLFMRSWSILGGKMEASGLQNRMENRCELRQANF